MTRNRLLDWLPALLIMATIFCFSSVPGRVLPNFGPLDLFVKKGGHVLGYAILALADWSGLRFDQRQWWLAMLLALSYAALDEFHQSFVLGRHPSWLDTLGFDGGGAGAALGLAYSWRAKRSRSIKSE